MLMWPKASSTPRYARMRLAATRSSSTTGSTSSLSLAACCARRLVVPQASAIVTANAIMPRRRATRVSESVDMACPPGSAAGLFERQHDRPRNRVGDAESPAEVFEGVPERVQRGDHVGPRLGERVHVVPL